MTGMTGITQCSDSVPSSLFWSLLVILLHLIYVSHTGSPCSPRDSDIYLLHTSLRSGSSGCRFVSHSVSQYSPRDTDMRSVTHKFLHADRCLAVVSGISPGTLAPVMADTRASVTTHCAAGGCLAVAASVSPRTLTSVVVYTCPSVLTGCCTDRSLAVGAGVAPGTLTSVLIHTPASVTTVNTADCCICECYLAYCQIGYH